ncbi:hypothetical protein TNCV_2461671 [Trichonephila clavipes]|nr:hypothetical protein TNCV_2461671 [Trichonephila clavipes]
MIINFFILELNNHDVQELWFQQDGATCHTVRATIDLLKDTFGDRLISRFGPVNWPLKSSKIGRPDWTTSEPATDHQIGTSVHAPQRPMVTYNGMRIVDPGPHGLLCH